MRRGGQLVLAGALLLVAGLTARMLLGARAEVQRAAAAHARDDGQARVRHLRRAIAYYLPGNPWVRTAHDELLRLARGGDREAARELRSAILGLRGLLRPYAGTLPELNRAIAGPGGTPALVRLEHPPEPHPGWAALGLVGFVLWVSGAFLMLARGLRADASIVRRRFWPLCGCVLLGLGLFCLGMAAA